jgi:diguanylate cyclase (GGDEF)-like protein
MQGVAKILSGSTRVTDFAARTGGEELSVLLPETGLFEAIHFGEKIRTAVAAAPVAGQPVTVSVGIASMPHSRFASPAELLYAADQALYRAKFAGRNRVESEKRRDRFARAEGSHLAARQRAQSASF